VSQLANFVQILTTCGELYLAPTLSYFHLQVAIDQKARDEIKT
jgi:hypothetical protein